jgi:hypothetical protein
MEIVYTSKFLRLLKKIKEKKAKIDTERVLDIIRNANDIRDLYKSYPNVNIETKPYSIDDSYRIGYSNNPSMRIRFCLNDNPNKKGKDAVLYLVMTKQDYKPWETTPINCNNLNESTQKRLKIVISESQFKRLFLN